MNDVTKPTVFVQYGFCEGSRIGHRFLLALEHAGFQLTEDPAQADIFIGHSAGCLLLPTSSRAQLNVFIGFPYWPNRSLVATLYKKNRREYLVSQRSGTTRTWWVKFRWNSIYFWNVRKNFSMWRAMKSGPQPPKEPDTLCIRNRDDDCCTPEIWQVPSLRQCAFLSVPGEHDHLWMHPSGYTAIIEAYYGASILASAKTQ